MKNLLLLFMFLQCLFIQAQNIGSIKGTVYDQETGLTLPGVNVWLDIMGQKVGSSTDMDGNFHINPVPSGEYIIHFSSMGYGTLNLTGVIVKPDQITFLNHIELQAGAIIGNEFEVTAKSEQPLINPEEPSKVVLLQKDLEKSALNKDPVAMLGVITTGAKTSEDGEVYFRGSRDGAALYYIDGIRVHSLHNVIPSQAIGSIAVYSGGIPAKFGDTTGGVVVIETQSYFDLYNRWKAEQPAD